jgi:hypothetical protein
MSEESLFTVNVKFYYLQDMLHLIYFLSWLAENSFKELVPCHMKLQLNETSALIPNIKKKHAKFMH